MTTDAKRQVLGRAVAAQIARERGLARLLVELTDGLGSPSAVRTAFEALSATTAQHLHDLTAYLSGLSPTPVANPTTTQQQSTAADGSVSSAVERVQTALASVITGYGALTALAFRLYEPALRELAPKHLRACIEASQALNQMLAAVVAQELLADGLDCHCVCPMCGIGACGCVAVTTRHITRAWRESVPPEEMDGLVLQQPRPGSQFAAASLQAGDRLLAIDDQQIRSLNDLMDGIRNHSIGDDMRLLIQRGADEPQTVLARPVSDY